MKSNTANHYPKALVTKSNELVEARYHFSLWETRVFTKLVSLIQPGDADFKKYKLQIKDLINFFGVNDNDAYAKIKAVPDYLLKKVITIPYTDEQGEERFLKTGLIAQASIPKKKEGFIELSFHPDLKPYLLQLKQKFLSYDIRNVLKISSVYSIRIYELLKQYETIGQREFEIDTLKVILGISDKYKLYGHFKDRIIKKAQEDLKQHTDICFTFTERKQGRRVAAIIFNIKKNTPADGEFVAEFQIRDTVQQEVENTLKDWGISKIQIQGYFKKYNGSYLVERIQYVLNQQELKQQKGEKIERLAAYFSSIVDNEQLVDYIEEEKKQKQQQKQKSKQTQNARQLLKEELKAIKKVLSQREEKLVYELFANNEELKKDTLVLVQRNNPLLYQEKTAEEYFQTNPLFRAAVFAQLKKEYAKAFKSIQKEYLQQIKELEDKLKLV